MTNNTTSSRVLACGCYADSPMGHVCASGGGEMYGTRIEGFIAMIPNYWGWGTTPKSAVARLRQANRGRDSVARGKRLIVALPAGALDPSVDDMGRIVWTWEDGADRGGTTTIIEEPRR